MHEIDPHLACGEGTRSSAGGGDGTCSSQRHIEPGSQSFTASEGVDVDNGDGGELPAGGRAGGERRHEGSGEGGRHRHR
jgi:hypothetical protein